MYATLNLTRQNRTYLCHNHRVEMLPKVMQKIGNLSQKGGQRYTKYADYTKLSQSNKMFDADRRRQKMTNS